jgi:hypothetical protein
MFNSFNWSVPFMLPAKMLREFFVAKVRVSCPVYFTEKHIILGQSHNKQSKRNKIDRTILFLFDYLLCHCPKIYLFVNDTQQYIIKAAYIIFHNSNALLIFTNYIKFRITLQPPIYFLLQKFKYSFHHSVLKIFILLFLP